MPFHSSRPRLAAVLPGLLALLGACTQSGTSLPEFQRHKYTAFTQPYDHKDVIYFDVLLSADYPDDDPAAEATRMKWLQGWLDQTHLCPAGYEIRERRPFKYTEDNPGHYDLRYVVRCRSPAA